MLAYEQWQELPGHTHCRHTDSYIKLCSHTTSGKNCRDTHTAAIRTVVSNYVKIKDNWLLLCLIVLKLQASFISDLYVNYSRDEFVSLPCFQNKCSEIK